MALNVALVDKLRGVAMSYLKIYFLLIITVHFVVFLCYMITRNESLNRNSAFSLKATIKMLQMPHFVVNHQILAKILPPYLHEPYSGWILPLLCKQLTNELKTIPFLRKQSKMQSRPKKSLFSSRKIMQLGALASSHESTHAEYVLSSNCLCLSIFFSSIGQGREW